MFKRNMLHIKLIFIVSSDESASQCLSTRWASRREHHALLLKGFGQEIALLLEQRVRFFCGLVFSLKIFILSAAGCIPQHHFERSLNLIQHAAIRFVALVDSHKEKLDALLQDLSINYSVKRNEHLFLFTVRHYNPSILEEELKNRELILTQKTRQTVLIIAK